MYQWHFITASVFYEALKNTPESIKADHLYFLSDTHEVYKGTTPFTEGVVFIDDTAEGAVFASLLAAIANPARNRIYMSTKTLEGKVYNGSAWKTVIRPVDTTVTKDSENLITSGAVEAYVEGKIGGGTVVNDIDYTAADHKLTVTMGEDTKEINLNEYGVELAYEDLKDGDDNVIGKVLKLKGADGTVLGDPINMDLERFVTAASYDNTNKKIILAFDIVEPGNEHEDVIEIPVGDLVDTYTAKEVANKDTVAVSVENNVISAAARISAVAGNSIEVKDDGMYVPTVDTSDKMDKITVEEGETMPTNEILTVDSTGNAQASGKTIGGAALAATPDANTVATEIAVNAVKEALETSIGKKIAKVTDPTAGDLVILTADGQIADAKKTIGGATLAEIPDANTVATEAAVAAGLGNKLDSAAVKSTIDPASATASTDVASVAAIADAFSWKTTL